MPSFALRVATVQTVDLGREAVADRETCGVVLRAVDAQTGGQALKSRRKLVTRCLQIALGIQRQGICVDDLEPWIQDSLSFT